MLYCCDHESCALPSCCATPAARSDIFPVYKFVLPLTDLVAVACAETYYLVHVQEAVEVSSCQSAKLMQVALSLRGVYQMLLEGATKREAFEDAAKFMRVATTTVKDWERAYRTKGYIEARTVYPVYDMLVLRKH